MKTTLGFSLSLIVCLGFFAAACSSGDSEQADVCDPACGSNGVCDNSSSPPVCSCFSGWAGPACSSCAAGYEDDGAGHCILEEEPETCAADSCNGHGLCDDSSGEVICSCEPGYTGPSCGMCQTGFHADDLGNCVENVSCSEPDPCMPNGVCDDTSGVGVCVCDEGWTGSTCADCAPDYHLNGANECVADEHCPGVDPCAPFGTCDDTDGVVVCVCETAYAGEFCDECAPGYFDSGNGCEEGGTCDNYPFADNTYVYEMRFADPDSPCCFDFDGDGIPDNAYGDLLNSLAGLVGDMNFNQMIADRIHSGELCQIFDMQDLDAVSDDDFSALSLMWGTDSDDNYENNLDGSESFTMDEDSFEAGDTDCSMSPVNAFDTASVTGGMLLAEAEMLYGLLFPFPLSPTGMMLLPIRQAKLSARLSTGVYGIELSEGKIGGAIPLDAFSDEMNDIIAESCACLDLDGPLITYELGEERLELTCHTADASTCSPDSTCQMMNDYCGPISMFLRPDVDSDGDAILDSMSVGLWFEATSATVTGITP